MLKPGGVLHVHVAPPPVFTPYGSGYPTLPAPPCLLLTRHVADPPRAAPRHALHLTVKAGTCRAGLHPTRPTLPVADTRQR